MMLIASRTPAKLSQGANSKSYATGRAVSKAIRSNSATSSEAPSNANASSTQTSVNSEFAVSSKVISNERTSLISSAMEQSHLSQAIGSFNANLSPASSAPPTASSAQSKSPWLSGGATDPGASKSKSYSEPESFNEGSRGSNRSEGIKNNDIPDLPKLPEKHTGETDPLVPNPDGVKLTQSEFDVIRYTNKLRELNGKDPLIVKENLANTADLSSDRMKAIGKMEHGLTSGWNGENIAKGQRSAEEVVNSWKNSPGHYRNMMADFKYIGVGDTIDRDGSVYWTQQFS